MLPLHSERGNVVIWVLHIIALVVFAPALFVTIPAHLIMNNMQAQPAPELNPEEAAIKEGNKTAESIFWVVVGIVFFFIWLLS